MDDVERGQTFTVTREGHGIAELIPLRRHRVFVTRAEFAASSAQAPDVDLDAFQADLDTAYDHDLHDPYGH